MPIESSLVLAEINLSAGSSAANCRGNCDTRMRVYAPSINCQLRAIGGITASILQEEKKGAAVKGARGEGGNRQRDKQTRLQH